MTKFRFTTPTLFGSKPSVEDKTPLDQLLNLVSAIFPTTPEGGDILAKFEGIKDPAERTSFYRKNKAAYDAAFSAKANAAK